VIDKIYIQKEGRFLFREAAFWDKEATAETHSGPGVYGGTETHKGRAEDCTYPDCGPLFTKHVITVSEPGKPLRNEEHNGYAEDCSDPRCAPSPEAVSLAEDMGDPWEPFKDKLKELVILAHVELLG
jgi:hypothetical protein